MPIERRSKNPIKTPENNTGVLLFIYMKGKPLVMYRETRKFAPWLKDNH